jgi:hypothetical protein
MLGLTSHLSVTLPIRIVSLLSVDPPTSVASPSDMIRATHDRDGRPNGPSGEPRLHHSELESRTDSPPTYRTRPPSLEQPQNTTVSNRLTHISIIHNAFSFSGPRIETQTNFYHRRHCHATVIHLFDKVQPRSLTPHWGTNRQRTRMKCPSRMILCQRG